MAKITGDGPSNSKAGPGEVGYQPPPEPPEEQAAPPAPEPEPPAEVAEPPKKEQAAPSPLPSRAKGGSQIQSSRLGKDSGKE